MRIVASEARSQFSACSDINLIVLASLIFVLAGFVKGVLGQGLPTVAVGLLSVIVSPGEAAALIVIPRF